MDLCDFRENAGRCEVHMFIKFRDTRTIEVIDVLVGDVLSETREELKDMRDSVELEAPGGVVVLFSFWPSSNISGRLLKGESLLSPRKLAITISAITIHSHHVTGAPCANWKARYLAKVNGGAIPRKKSYTSIPEPYDFETFTQAKEALSSFGQSHLRAIKEAYIGRTLATRALDQDLALVVYVSRVPGPDLEYRAEAVADFSVKEALKIFPNAMPELTKLHILSGSDRLVDGTGLIFIYALGRNTSIMVPLTIDAREVAAVSANGTMRAVIGIGGVTWKIALLYYMGAKTPVFRARDEALEIVESVKKYYTSW